MGTSSTDRQRGFSPIGNAFFEAVMRKLEPQADISWQFTEGQFVVSGQTVGTLSGNLVQILKAERVALNFIGHLSGVATLTRCFVAKTVGTRCKILDTRKTLPGLRIFEKQAVVHGGGENHRMNLSDAILIKENHIRMMGGIRKAVNSIRSRSALPIEVEVTNLDEVKESLALKVDRLLLDNMSAEEIKKALEFVPSSVKTEASGNMTLDRISEVAATGVDYISVGALTHSAPTADFSLQFDWSEAGNNG